MNHEPWQLATELAIPYWKGLGGGGGGLRRGIDNTLKIFMLLKVALSLRH